MLLGLLSGSVRARKAQGKPLRVVIMSATLRMTDFTENKMLFPNLSKSNAPAVVQIDNRMHPVIVHYERRTEEEYVPLIIDKISQIHKTLPAGTILIFVTGKGEVHRICNSFREGQLVELEEDENSESEEYEEDRTRGEAVVVESFKRIKQAEATGAVPDTDPDFNLGNKDGYTEELTFKKNNTVEQKPVVKSTASPIERKKKKPTSSVVVKENSAKLEEIVPFTGGGSESRLRLFPLYAQMSSERQMEVFRANSDYPEDRIVVVATNVAETSLTIPNVRYVVDSGREKRKEFNSNGVSRFAVRFNSKASANQRAGRAGRVGPGHVYRLFSPNVFGEHMADFSAAEIETNPLDSAILFLRSLGVPSVANFPWPSPPPASHVEAAMRRLKAIGAISADPKDRVTEIGKQISSFPVAPRLAVALVQVLNHSVDYGQKSMLALVVIAAIAMLSVECIADTSAGDAEQVKSREISITNFSDDLELVVHSFIDWTLREDREALVKERSLNPKAMDEATSLFFLLVKQCRKMKEWQLITNQWGDRPERHLQSVKGQPKLMRFVRECFTHSFVDQIAVREEAGARTYRAPHCSDPVQIFRFSAVYRLKPQLIGYTDMQQSSVSERRSMRMCFPIDPEYLATVKSPLIDRSKPHPMMKSMLLKDGRRVAWVVPRYTPLSITIVDCIKVDLD